MIETERDKGEGRPPDTYDLGDVLATRHTEEAGKTDEPVGTDTPEENLVPHGGDLLGGRKNLGLLEVAAGGEDAAVYSSCQFDTSTAMYRV